MNKYVATAGVTVALLGGSLAVAAVNPLSLAGAQDTTTSTAPADTAPGSGAARVRPLDAALSELVADGTLTQEQADAVTARTEEKRDALGGDHGGPGGERGDHGGRGGFFGGIGEAADAIASQLGITTTELKDALVNGTSLNDLAAQHGVDPAAVSQAIVDAANTRIDAALADGRITQEQADSAKTKVTDTVAGLMDGTIKGPGRGGDKPPMGHRPGDAGDAGDAGGA